MEATTKSAFSLAALTRLKCPSCRYPCMRCVDEAHGVACHHAGPHSCMIPVNMAIAQTSTFICLTMVGTKATRRPFFFCSLDQLRTSAAEVSTRRGAFLAFLALLGAIDVLLCWRCVGALPAHFELSPRSEQIDRDGSYQLCLSIFRGHCSLYLRSPIR